MQYAKGGSLTGVVVTIVQMRDENARIGVSFLLPDQQIANGDW